jgi:hypothetical protein
MQTQAQKDRDPIAVPFKDAFIGPDGLYNVGGKRGRELIVSGEVDSFVDGNKRMVVVASLRDYVARKTANRPAVVIAPEVSAIKSRAGKLGKAAQMARAKADQAS